MRDLSMQDVLAVPRHWFHAASRPETGNRLRVPRCRSLPPPRGVLRLGSLRRAPLRAEVECVSEGWPSTQLQL